MCLYALRALPPAEAQTMEHHLASCEVCRQHLTGLRPLVDSFTAWPVELMRPANIAVGPIADPNCAGESGQDR